MSHFEYVCSGELTPEFEERTTNLVSILNSGAYVPFVIHKYWDEVVNETTKKRYVIIHTHMNMRDYFQNHFKTCVYEMHGYYKQLIF
jgi:hypothetical protein